MNATPALYIEGLAFWAPTLPGWDIARAAFRGEGQPTEPPMRRPAPSVLAPAERRRAPDAVALALEVAGAAVAASAFDAADLPCVFASTHGDLPITDYMCSTLATAPGQLSPTKFHNSVHNAAVGYWTIGTGCMQASNAVSGFDCSFATALLEAAAQCVADAQPVLLVGFDGEAVGPLAQVHASQGLLAGGLVLSPQRTGRTVAALAWSLVPGPTLRGAAQSDAARALPPNAMAELLPLFEALAGLPDHLPPAPLRMPLGERLSLELHLGH